MINIVSVFFLFPIDRANITTFFAGNQSLNESDTLSLTSNCAADGNPTPSITWIRLSDNSPVNKPVLTITGKQDEGGYKCTASNGVGSPDNRTVYIVVASELFMKYLYSKLYFIYFKGLKSRKIKILISESWLFEFYVFFCFCKNLYTVYCKMNIQLSLNAKLKITLGTF